MPGWLKAVFHVVGVAIETAAKAIAIAAKFLATKAWAAVRFVGRHVVDFGRAVGHAFGKLWDTVLRPAIHAILQAAHDAWLFVRDVASKIIRVLRQVYHVFDWVYTRYVRPLLSFIDQVRRILQILAKLGVKWAADLDRVLARVQTWIYNAFELVRSKLNNLISVINLVLDPRLLIRANVLLASVNDVAGGILSLMVHHGILGTKTPPLPTLDPIDPAAEAVAFNGGVYLRSQETARALGIFREIVTRVI